MYLPVYEQLLLGAIKLDVFSHLESPVTAGALSRETGWNEYNTLNLLKGLYSLGYLERNGDAFCNKPETSKYLVKDKPSYIGSILIFFCNNPEMNLGDVEQQVKEGPRPLKETQQTMDFAAYGDAMRAAQSGIRQQELLELIRGLPENKSIKSILDLGCGPGELGLALVQDEPGRTGVLFDKPAMKTLIEETVALENAQEKITIMNGDFVKDDIGNGYDLILCSSMMLFAIASGADFFAKLKNALNPGGVVVCLNEGIEPDYSGPWDMVVGYMAFNLQGVPMGIIRGQIAEAAKAGGFASVENRSERFSTGNHDINILRLS